MREPAAVRAAGRRRGAPCRVAGPGRDAAGAARGLPGGVRGAADGGGVVHRPGVPCRDGVRGLQLHCDRETAGYGRSRGRDYYAYHGQPKTCWLYELAPGGIAALAAGFDAPVLAGRRAPDFNRLRVSGERGLLEYLAQVTDHRKPKGRRHDLAAILVVVVVARLCGANSVYAAAQFAQTMPQEALRRCGIRYNARLGRHVPPSHKTIKRTIRAIDAGAADTQMCAWLRAEASAGRLDWRHIAIDGKTVRGAVRPDGTQPHLLAAYDVTAGTVLGQADVEAKTNEIVCHGRRGGADVGR